MKFYDVVKRNYTIGDLVRAILAIDNEVDAKEFYESYIEVLAQYRAGNLGAEQTPKLIADANIGWCFGEGMSQERVDMWRRVTDASHPAFGGHVPSAKEAFEAGLKFGKRGIK